MSVKHKNNDTLSMIRNDEKYINDQITIVNTFNNFFTSTAEAVRLKIKFSNQSFRSFLLTKKNNSFIITAANKKETCKIISCLNINDSCGPNGIPTKILHLVQDQISKLYVTYLSLKEYFPLFWRQPKYFPFKKPEKKDSKLEVSNYRPISLLSNINNISE